MGRKSRKKREKRAGTWIERTASGKTIHFGGEDWAALEPALRRQIECFREKFGRDPGPGDPILFDADADEPRPMPETKVEAGIVDAMEKAGLDPAFIYAYQHTG